MNVHVPLDAFGICEANVVGGVHDTDALLVFVTIVPVAEPKLYVMVSVYELSCLVIPIVRAVPIVPFDADNVEAATFQTA